MKDKELDVNQLETVSGGNLGMTSADSEFFHDIGVMNDSYSTTGLLFSWESKSAIVDEAWSKFGITCVSSPIGNNLYYYEGREISRLKALQMAMQKAGKSVDLNKYWNDPND